MNIRRILCRFGFHAFHRLPNTKTKPGFPTPPYEFVCVHCGHSKRISRTEPHG